MLKPTTKMANIDDLLAKSKATDPFKEAVKQYLQDGHAKLIRHSPGAPKIKVIRVLTKLLEQYPDEPICDVDIEGVSSCSRFHGTLRFGPNRPTIEFDWDCSWKAEQEDWQTWYGAPDQTKAAQVFGYQCFKKFQRRD